MLYTQCLLENFFTALFTEYCCERTVNTHSYKTIFNLTDLQHNQSRLFLLYYVQVQDNVIKINYHNSILRIEQWIKIKNYGSKSKTLENLYSWTNPESSVRTTRVFYYTENCFFSSKRFLFFHIKLPKKIPTKRTEQFDSERSVWCLMRGAFVYLTLLFSPKFGFASWTVSMIHYSHRILSYLRGCDTSGRHKGKNKTKTKPAFITIVSGA